MAKCRPIKATLPKARTYLPASRLRCCALLKWKNRRRRSRWPSLISTSRLRVRPKAILLPRISPCTNASSPARSALSGVILERSWYRGEGVSANPSGDRRLSVPEFVGAWPDTLELGDAALGSAAIGNRCRLVKHHNGINLDLCTLGQCRYFDRGARRIGLGHVFGHDAVDVCESAQIGQVDVEFDAVC